MEDLTREFLLESHEGLDRMERCLAKLTETPADAELLREIFRAVHTIKGTTGFLGYQRLERVAHVGENVLVRLRDGDLAVTAPLLDVLLLLLDTLRGILRGIEQNDCEPEGADTSLLEQLEALHVAPSVKNVALHASSPPAPDAIPSQAAASIPAQPEAATLQNPAPEKFTTENSEADAPVESPAPVVAAVPVEAAASPETPLSPEATSAVLDSTVRVDVDILQRLMNLAGELVLTRNQIVAVASEGQIGALAQRLDRVTGEIRDAVMRVRMQPVKQVFTRFPSLVRELARQCGKQVRLEMEGQETRLDRSVLEMMRDPLLHSIRNAIDHGIEVPEVRTAQGKSAEGRLTLRAASIGDHVVLEITDDGGGISPDKLRRHAIKKGLISEVQAAALSDHEARNLVFMAGFSTAAQVTNVSGRGVGLDVVRQNVERAGGSVELHSTEGVGTTLRMRLPLTLAILPALIVRSAGQRFALPQTAVVELHRLSATDQTSSVEHLGAASFYRLRDRLLPLTELNALLHMTTCEISAPQRSSGPLPAGMSHDASAYAIPENSQTSKDEWNVVVLNVEGRSYGLRVDTFDGTEELVAKPLEQLTDAPVFSGAAQLADGSLALILDIAVLADMAGISTEQTSVAADAHADSSTGESYLHIALRDVPAAIPVAHVEHVISVQASQIQSLGEVFALQLDGELLPLLDGARSDGARSDGARTRLRPGTGGHRRDLNALVPATEAPSPSWHVLVCSHDEGRMGLLVSAVYGMVQAEVRPLKNLLHPEDKNRGVLSLGNTLVRVIEPMDWRHFSLHPEQWIEACESADIESRDIESPDIESRDIESHDIAMQEDAADTLPYLPPSSLPMGTEAAG